MASKTPIAQYIMLWKVMFVVICHVPCIINIKLSELSTGLILTNYLYNIKHVNL